jgi:hypothetical protein
MAGFHCFEFVGGIIPIFVGGNEPLFPAPLRVRPKFTAPKIQFQSSLGNGDAIGGCLATV